MPDALRLLLVEDEPIEAVAVTRALEGRGRFRVRHVASAADALEELGRAPFDVVLSDVVMPDVDGIELVRRIREIDRSLPVILFTATAGLERAVAAMGAGAADFLEKPVAPQALEARLERAIAERGLRASMQQARRGPATDPADLVPGDHPKLDEVRRIARKVSSSPYTRLLITGESGTGKSLLARAVHALGGATGELVEVNCTALPEALLESELFGHEKGAFTDAKAMKRGLVEVAHHGTLFLDEIGAMPLPLQAKLLTYLERREIRRVGGTAAIPVATRVVAATNEDLTQAVADGRFREDLLYRLNVVSARMPALRDIPTVIPDLARRLVGELCAELNRPVPPVDEASLLALTHFPWPGNIRELRNVLEHGLIFHEGPRPFAPPPPPSPHQPPALPMAPGTPPASPGTGALALPPGLTLEEVQRAYVGAALAGRPSAGLGEVARGLGISRKTLWEMRRRWGLA